MPASSCRASAGSRTSSGSGAAMPCQPVARRLVITNRPAGARPSSALTWPGAVTLSSTTSHPEWLASQAAARSRSASSGSGPASAGCSATASAARPVSIPAGLSAVIHQIRL